MNTDLVEQKGLKPLEPAFKRIAALKDAHKLATLMGELEAEGSPAPLFDFGVEQDEKDSSKQIADHLRRAASRCPTATTTLWTTRASRRFASSTSST